MKLEIQTDKSTSNMAMQAEQTESGGRIFEENDLMWCSRPGYVL